MALSKITSSKGHGIGSQLQSFIDQQASSRIEALQGALQLPLIMPGQPIRLQKKKSVRIGGERVSIPIIRIAAASDSSTEKTLGECIIRAVSSRCIAHQCVDLEFLTMICNWASALPEGSEEVAAALSEAGYSAEQHTINFDLSLHGVNGMASLPVVVRYLVQKHPKLIDHHLFADELSRLGRALQTAGYGPLEYERGFTIYEVRRRIKRYATIVSEVLHHGSFPREDHCAIMGQIIASHDQNSQKVSTRKGNPLFSEISRLVFFWCGHNVWPLFGKLT